MTAIFLPPRSAWVLIGESALTTKVAPSTQIGRLKSTFSWRDRVLVVVPHSMSILPLMTASKRVASSTGDPGDVQRVELELLLDASRHALAQLHRVPLRRVLVEE